MPGHTIVLPAAPPPPSVTYAEYLSITLSVLTLLVTLYGIIIALASWWGYNRLFRLVESKSREAATSAAIAYTADYVRQQEFVDKIKAMIAPSDPQTSSGSEASNAVGPDWPMDKV